MGPIDERVVRGPVERILRHVHGIAVDGDLRAKVLEEPEKEARRAELGKRWKEQTRHVGWSREDHYVHDLLDSGGVADRVSPLWKSEDARNRRADVGREVPADSCEKPNVPPEPDEAVVVEERGEEIVREGTPHEDESASRREASGLVDGTADHGAHERKEKLLARLLADGERL
jgi:hypothetical protein